VRVVVVAVGSRGDVQPYTALAAGLAAAGHEVAVATHAGFAELVGRTGLAFRPIAADPRAVVESEQGQAWLASARNPVTFFTRLMPLARAGAAEMADDIVDACRDADLIVYSTLGAAAWHAGQASGTLAVPAPLVPVSLTRQFATALAPVESLGPWLNLLSHSMVDVALDLPFRGAINRWRKDRLGLGPVRTLDLFASLQKQGLPVVYGFSPTIVPRPSDWRPNLHVTGAWFLDAAEDWQPDGRLAAFLDAGPAPVFAGFGSMRPPDPAKVAADVAAALRAEGLRGIVSAGWAGLAVDHSDDILVVDEVPHDWLFPRMAAVVHHGGAGTTATALRAGVPSMAVPFFADQFFWARRAAGLGVGPPALPIGKLDTDHLALRLRRLTGDATVRANAAEVGERIRAEDGVKEAVRVLESLPVG
jgi:UDP:flavonoid glycosyltransferase YjiC (YdhE family)